MNACHLAASFSGSVMAIGEFETTVHLWNVAEPRCLGTLNTVLDFGGDRLAITGDGKQVVAGNWTKGVAAYCTASLSTQWHRKDLKHPQHIRISADDKRIICCLDRKPCQELDRSTGETVRTFRGVRELWDSPYEPVRLTVHLNKKRFVETIDGEKLFEIPKETFAILSTAFSPGFVCTSESTGAVRCFDTQSGEEVWRFAPEKGSHFLNLGYVEQASSFAGVCLPYEGGGHQTLFRLGDTLPTCKPILDLGHCGDSAFCLHGSQLMLGSGDLINSLTGEPIHQLWSSSAPQEA